MSLGLASISPITPSDNWIKRIYQMIEECALRVWELFSKTTPLFITQERLKEKLDAYQAFFTSNTAIPEKNLLTPKEVYFLRKKPSFETLRQTEALQTVRTHIMENLSDGVFIFVTSRLTARFIEDHRLGFAEVFRYLGGRDLKHIGFIIKQNNQLLMSHHVGIKEDIDPLFLVHTLILKVNLSGVEKGTQQIFNQNLLEQAQKPRENLRGMGAWVILPFILGHKRLWGGASPDPELKEGQREMCSSFVAKVLLIALKAAKMENPVSSNEILERIHIVRFFELFRNHLEEVLLPEKTTKAFPSPTKYIRRFLP